MNTHDVGRGGTALHSAGEHSISRVSIEIVVNFYAFTIICTLIHIITF